MQLEETKMVPSWLYIFGTYTMLLRANSPFLGDMLVFSGDSVEFQIGTQNDISRHSMYGTFSYMWSICMVHVGKYAPHLVSESGIIFERRSIFQSIVFAFFAIY